MKGQCFLSSTILLVGFYLCSTITLASPQCASAASDPDGDGYGWEDNQTCLVDSAAVTTPPVTIALTDCIDEDGDGYGWNGVATCLPANTTAESSPPQNSAPVVTTQSVTSNVATTELQPAAINVGNSLPYPERSGFDIKSLSTDFWSNKQDLLSANISGVSVNLVWPYWQPDQQTNCTDSQVKFDGHCFTINRANDLKIKYWSSQGKTVTAVLYGTPAWARNNSTCTAASDRELFCAPREANDYARFTAFIADRYNGQKNNGRVVDFVIHNEVNMNEWYKVGCGNGIACDQEQWITDYTQNFNAAYDRITEIQPAAKVMVPFAHHFETSFDDPTGSNPIISVKTFLRGMNARAGGRKWRVAYHPYHKQLQSADSSFDDLPNVTFGNIGVLAGWLRQEFPLQPESWQIQLTENGVSSNGLSDESRQNVAVCNSYRNVLGTPGIENYIYHRMQDHPSEAANGAAFGLRRADGSAKPVWDTWANMSGRNGQRNNLTCGFENLPYTRLSSVVDNNGNYRASTRTVGAGYNFVNDWYLLREYQLDTYMAYECQSGASSYISTDVYCGGAHSYGPVGYVHRSNADSRVALYTCANGSQIYSSDSAGCAGEQVREFIGYVRSER